MSINRVGTALVAAVGCLMATDLSQASAAEPARDAGRPMQIKAAGAAMKLEKGRLVVRAGVGELKKANSEQSASRNLMQKKRMPVRR